MTTTYDDDQSHNDAPKGDDTPPPDQGKPAKKQAAHDAGGRITGAGLTSAAAALAYAGALPLILIAVVMWARGAEENGLGLMREFTIVYGAALVAFFGGVRWGVAVMDRRGPTFRNLIGGVAPMLLGVVILMMTIDIARLALLIVALPVMLIDDLSATRRGSGAPGWYLSVRIPLTLMLLAALVAVLIHWFAF